MCKDLSYGYVMYEINRSVAIIKPKQPYITWANSLPDADREFSPDVFRKDCSVVLIAEYDTVREARAHINNIWEDIFEDELYGWSTNEAWWPKERTQKMFWQWLDVEFHSMVFDPYEDEVKKYL
jgi:hypothetical protein